MRKIYVQFCENFMPLLIAVAIAVTLINNKSLGDQHLIAYICYFLVSSIIGIIVFFNWLLIKDTKKNYFPVYILIFIILSAYIFIKAEQTGIFVLKQYYWIASAIFFVSIQLAVSIIKNGKNANQFFSFRKTILLLISFLAIFDSIIVLLQFIGIITLKGNIFKCTGTWAHPNVTAMFLSMSVFCFFYMRKSTPSKVETIVINIGLLFTILAIALLKCRSAYLVVLIFLAFEYITPNIINKIKSIKIGFRILILAFILLAIVFTLSFLIASKQASTNGRLMIAENCLRLIKSKPITGYGFGTFEKTYNDYSVSLKITQNEFVNYAYNDFLELGVEGGIPAFFLWSLFIFFVIIFSYRGVRSEYNILPAVIAFLILQLTNFAFYALPVFSVFLVYVGLITPSPEVINSKFLTQYFRISVSKKVKNIFAVIGICISATFFFSALFIGVALHKNATINNTSSILEKRFEFENIGHYLNGYPQYHEYYGDYWMKENRNDSALLQFCIALKNTDAPKLLLKTGYCFQQMNLYDSSEFYFKKAIMIQPYKFFPRLFLLKMYVAKQDSAKVIKEAEQIVLMPIKVKSKEVDIIKEYAQKILKQY